MIECTGKKFFCTPQEDPQLNMATLLSTWMDGLPAGDFKAMNKSAKYCGRVQQIEVCKFDSDTFIPDKCLPEKCRWPLSELVRWYRECVMIRQLYLAAVICLC